MPQLPTISHPTKPRSISILGRRWFQRSYGNTYFTAQILVDGKKVHDLPQEYGYGDHYVTAAQDWLSANGHLPERDAWTSLRGFCENEGIEFHYSATDVGRERDL